MQTFLYVLLRKQKQKMVYNILDTIIVYVYQGCDQVRVEEDRLSLPPRTSQDEPATRHQLSPTLCPRLLFTIMYDCSAVVHGCSLV